jgi:prepilin-type N-terminal cleavage/methylation domain-containing protein
MLKRRELGEAGFTLIEVIIVMAISSALLVIVLVGQRGLRSRAQFDAAVNKLVATVGEARTEATAGVNIVGSGDGTNVCPGGPAGQYVFAGVAWTADNSLPGSPLKIDYYRALPGVTACVFQTRSISLPAPLTVNAPGGRMLFVRDDQGGLAVCPVNNLGTNVIPSFRDGSCATGTLTLNLSDAPDPHISQVIIDQSGLARRVN